MGVKVRDTDHRRKPVTIMDVPPDKLGSLVDGYVMSGGYVEVHHNMVRNTYIIMVRFD